MQHSEPAHSSHSENDHPFHLVDPSPWPLCVSLALLCVTAGMAMFMHKIAPGKPLALFGGAFLLTTVFFWWRDVIREGLYDHAHTPAVSNGLRIGMALFIASEVMFFVAFFWAFFNASLYPHVPVQEAFEGLGKTGVWPPVGIRPLDAWHIPFMNTLILLLSGTTATWAHYALYERRYDDMKTALWCTVLLGASFSGLQFFEYQHAPFAFTQGIYASTFYMATGFHGFHVLIGTLFLTVNLVRVYRAHLTPEHHLSFEFAAWYWHFVDVVWLFLFVFVYWWGA
jgi:cytochrome c oxidase subunit 3